mmetsp:Transcript_1771/g.5265  ORF Transcript_1771/g.5265 Transcript_1771/m.5265 type:complete len:155 (+) Transcript_1771:1251-1715(+)
MTSPHGSQGDVTPGSRVDAPQQREPPSCARTVQGRPRFFCASAELVCVATAGKTTSRSRYGENSADELFRDSARIEMALLEHVETVAARWRAPLAPRSNRHQQSQSGHIHPREEDEKIESQNKSNRTNNKRSLWSSCSRTRKHAKNRIIRSEIQ